MFNESLPQTVYQVLLFAQEGKQSFPARPRKRERYLGAMQGHVWARCLQSYAMHALEHHAQLPRVPFGTGINTGKTPIRPQRRRCQVRTTFKQLSYDIVTREAVRCVGMHAPASQMQA
jgi:hypothetical protein